MGLKNSSVCLFSIFINPPGPACLSNLRMSLAEAADIETDRISQEEQWAQVSLWNRKWIKVRSWILVKRSAWQEGEEGDRVCPGTIVSVHLSRGRWVAGCQGAPGSMFVTSPQARNLTSALWFRILKVFQSLLNLGRLTHANNADGRLRSNNIWCSSVDFQHKIFLLGTLYLINICRYFPLQKNNTKN